MLYEMSYNPRRCNRIYVKMPISLLVESQGAKVVHDTSTVDLSHRGARVRARIPLWPGQSIEVIANTGPKLAVPSRVVWVHATSADQDGEAGLEFLRPLPAAT